MKRRGVVARPRPVSPTRADPSRTGPLGRRLARELLRRYARLKATVARVVGDLDSFGVTPTVNADALSAVLGAVSGRPGDAGQEWPGLGGTRIVSRGVTVTDDGSSISAGLATDRVMTIPGLGEIKTLGPVAYADAVREEGRVVLMKVHADEELQGKGIPRRLIEDVRAVGAASALPLRTTGVFSDAGRTMMDKMVRDRVAVRTDGGDYEVLAPPPPRAVAPAEPPSPDPGGGALVGPSPQEEATAPAPFGTSSDKVKRFRAWLREQTGTTLRGDELLRSYVGEAYTKGVRRTADELPLPDVQDGQPVSPDDVFQRGRARGRRDEFVRQTVAEPATVEKVKLLAGRTFNELEDVDARMGTRMSRVLADGLVSGMTSKQIAKRMVEEVDLELPRALTIVRTELVRAHSEGQLDAMAKVGVTGVTAAVEWDTAGDYKVCARCRSLDGQVFTLSEARGMLPVHPNCRCAWSAAPPEAPPRPTTNARPTPARPSTPEDDDALARFSELLEGVE